MKLYFWAVGARSWLEMKVPEGEIPHVRRELRWWGYCTALVPRLLIYVPAQRAFLPAAIPAQAATTVNWRQAYRDRGVCTARLKAIRAADTEGIANASARGSRSAAA